MILGRSAWDRSSFFRELAAADGIGTTFAPGKMENRGGGARVVGGKLMAWRGEPEQGRGASLRSWGKSGGMGPAGRRLMCLGAGRRNGIDQSRIGWRRCDGTLAERCRRGAAGDSDAGGGDLGGALAGVSGGVSGGGGGFGVRQFGGAEGVKLSPATQRLLGDVFAAAGLPDGVLNIVTNGPEHSAEVVGALISHPAVRRVNFTGSTRVGRLVAAFAARHLKRSLLEPSGKCPLILLPDADIDAAEAAAVHGAFLNQGQICMSTDTVIVHDAVTAEFVEKLVAAASQRHLQATDPRLGQADLGPVARLAVARRLTELIEDARAKGGVVRCGGKAAGTFLDATVIDHVSTAMRKSALGLWWGSAGSRRSKRRSRWPTATSMALRPRSFRAISTARCGWQASWRPGFALSMIARWPTGLTCHSAA